jgi:glycosyltransferase involved in cell wall biosynthesis
MRLLMVSGDRQVVVGEKGPFHAMQREFSRHFERIDVLVPRPDRPVAATTIWDKVHFHPAPVGRARMAAWIAREGARLVREHGVALVVSHDYGWFYNGVGSARVSRATGVPYLSELHHVPGHPVAANLKERFDQALARVYVGWALDRAKAFRVVNDDEMPALLRSWGVPDERILVLPSLYIDLRVFQPGVAAKDVDVLYVGRMVENKGLDRIVDAVARLGPIGGARPRLRMVGKGPLLERTRRSCDERGVRADFIEWVASPEELAEVYRRAKVVVCASTCEGGPRFTVEAMACGVPVASTPVGVMSSLLADGSCGELTGFDADSLAAGLARLLSDESRRAAAGRAAAERARRVEQARVVAGYAQGLKRLVGDSS